MGDILVRWNLLHLDVDYSPWCACYAAVYSMLYATTRNTVRLVPAIGDVLSLVKVSVAPNTTYAQIAGGRNTGGPIGASTVETSSGLEPAIPIGRAVRRRTPRGMSWFARESSGEGLAGHTGWSTCLSGKPPMDLSRMRGRSTISMASRRTTGLRTSSRFPTTSTTPDLTTRGSPMRHVSVISNSDSARQGCLSISPGKDTR